MKKEEKVQMLERELILLIKRIKENWALRMKEKMVGGEDRGVRHQTGENYIMIQSLDSF